MTGVLVGLVVVFLIPLSLLLLGRGVVRRGSLESYARQHGDGFTPVVHGFGRRWSGGPFGVGGGGKDASSVVAGTRGGHAFLAFDYTMVDGGEMDPPYVVGVYVLTLPHALPTLEVSRDRVTVPGLERIDLESDDFNREFHVAATDRRYAYDVLGPRAMQAMLSQADLSYRFEGASLIAWGAAILRPERIDPVVGALAVVADSIGASVWSAYGSSAG